MSVKSVMTALADQVRRLSGRTETMSVETMTSALSGVEAGGGNKVYSGTVTTSAGNVLTIDTGVNVASSDVFMLLYTGSSYEGSAYNGYGIFVVSAIKTPSEVRTSCASAVMDDEEAYPWVYNVNSGVTYSGTKVNVSVGGLYAFVPETYYWCLIKG